MSAEKRKNVDIVGLKKELAIILSVMGIVYLLLGIIGLCDVEINIWLFLVITFAFSIIIIWRANKYDHNPNNKRNTLITIGIIGVIFIIIFVSIERSLRINTITATPENIEIAGGYGMTIERANIDTIMMCKHVPAIRIRTNGVAMNNALKGHFIMANGNKAMLYIQNATLPSILITTRNNLYIYINTKSEVKTEELFKELTQ